MNIDELQERFNELRKKKLVTTEGNYPAEIVGFFMGLVYPTIHVKIKDDI